MNFNLDSDESGVGVVAFTSSDSSVNITYDLEVNTSAITATISSSAKATHTSKATKCSLATIAFTVLAGGVTLLAVFIIA